MGPFFAANVSGKDRRRNGNAPLEYCGRYGADCSAQPGHWQDARAGGQSATCTAAITTAVPTDATDAANDATSAWHANAAGDAADVSSAAILAHALARPALINTLRPTAGPCGPRRKGKRNGLYRSVGRSQSPNVHCTSLTRGCRIGRCSPLQCEVGCISVLVGSADCVTRRRALLNIPSETALETQRVRWSVLSFSSLWTITIPIGAQCLRPMWLWRRLCALSRLPYARSPERYGSSGEAPVRLDDTLHACEHPGGYKVEERYVHSLFTLWSCPE